VAAPARRADGYFVSLVVNIPVPPMNIRCLKRIRYFTGQLLSAEDLEDEQEYLLARLRRHNRFLHGWGVVAGLTVDIADGNAVVIQPGLAIDCAGNELVLESEVRISIAVDCERQYAVLRYVEVGTDEIPNSQGQPTFSRTEETACAELQPSNPSAGHRGIGPGSPGCGQAHSVLLATISRHHMHWRVVSRRKRA
jgi:hypothetical protein